MDLLSLMLFFYPTITQKSSPVPIEVPKPAQWFANVKVRHDMMVESYLQLVYTYCQLDVS